MEQGRGWLNAFNTMPKEADGIVAWAGSELALRKRTQTDIYAEFVTRCEALMAEHRGELEFSIPKFTAFNQYSIRQAKMARTLAEKAEVSAIVSQHYNPKTSNDLAIMNVELLKAKVNDMLTDDADSLTTKEVKELSEAVRNLEAALKLSGEQKRKYEEEKKKQVSAAVDAVAKAKGLSAETAEEIKAGILGVTAG